MNVLEPVSLKESPRIKNLKGRESGYLVAVAPFRKTWPNGRRTIVWQAVCKCGNTVYEQPARLRNDVRISCGCDTRSKSHGLSGTRVHRFWCLMIRRCEDPSYRSWHKYGGRGIRVCNRWQDIRNFVKDMGHPPSDEHSLQLINPSLNYQKSNCRWAVVCRRDVSSLNDNLLTFRGRTQTISAWAREIGISHQGLISRLDCGWTIEEALTTKKGEKRK